jgi:hypothetical protein
LVKRTFAILLSVVLIAAPSVHTTHAQTEQTSSNSEGARAAVERLGVGPQARTEITLRDKKKVKGYVSAAGADSFTITDQKTGASQTIAYTDVLSVRRRHGGMKTRSWIIIAGAAAAAVIVGIIIKPALCDGC